MIIEIKQKFGQKIIMVNTDHIIAIEKSVLGDDCCTIRMTGRVDVEAEISYHDMKHNFTINGYDIPVFQ